MAKQFMNPPVRPMVRPILEIKRTKERYCNICAKHADNKQQVNEMMFGCNNQATSVILCDSCLQKFGDILWKYMDTNNL